MIRAVLFTGDIFRQQPRGGITRYIIEIARRLERPAEVVMGLHQSAEAAGLRVPLRAALRLPALRGVHRLAGPVNAVVDACWLGSRRGVIVHPTYYRDPRGLPARAPMVVTVHDMTHERLPKFFPADRWDTWEPARYKAGLCRRADRILCNSETTRSDLLELMDVPEAKVRLTPHASRDWSPVTPAPLERPEGPFVLWVGERHAYKNFLPALAAWAGCAEAAGTRLLCVGGGPFRPRERAAIDAAGVAARVFQRTVTDGELRWAYEHARALIHASLWEGFGVTLLEALDLGCPVLASDRPPFREVAGDAAVFAEPTDRDALTDGLRAVLAQSREPGQVARRRAQAVRFSWDTCATQHEAVYRELD
jgi:glycosyltransferase involved in cell wall biosynthesis